MSLSQGLAYYFQQNKAAVTGVYRAQDHQLRDIIRDLLPLSPDIDIYTTLSALANAPENSIAVLVPLREELSQIESIVAAKKLSLVLWDRADTMRQDASLSWVLHWVECPQTAPAHGVDCLRRAEMFALRYFMWRGKLFEESYRAAFPGQEIVWGDAECTFAALQSQLKQAKRAKWIIWRNVEDESQLQLIKHADQKISFAGKHILFEPKHISETSTPLLRGKVSSLEDTLQALSVRTCKQPGRLAALTGLEYEAIDLVKNLAFRGNSQEKIEEILLSRDDPGRALYEHPELHGINYQTDSIRYRNVAQALVAQRAAPSKEFAYALHLAFIHIYQKYKETPAQKPLIDALLVEATGVGTISTLAELEPEHYPFFVDVTPEKLAQIADSLVEQKKHKKASRLYQEAIRLATEQGKTQFVVSYLLKLASEEAHTDTSAAIATLERARAICAPEQEIEFICSNAEIYARLGHPMLSTWIDAQQLTLLAALHPDHPKIKRLQELKTAYLTLPPLGDVQKTITALRLKIGMQHRLLHHAALLTEVTLDETVITSQIERNKIKINPYVFANEELRTIVMVRALLQCILLHAYDPQNPENEATLKRLSAPWLERRDRSIRWFPEWLAAMDNPSLHFVTPQKTREETIAFWSTSLSFAEPHARQGPLYEALTSLGYDLNTPASFIDEVLVATAKKIIAGRESVLAPEKPEEKFLLMLTLVEQCSTVEQALAAFRWVATSVDASFTQIFGNNLVVRMRNRNVQGMLALAIQREPSTRAFLASYRELLGLKPSPE